MNRILIAPFAAGVLLAGCAVGPDYERPAVDLPKDFGVAQSGKPADAQWWKVFRDPVLDKFIEEALAANRNLAVAAERIEQARAQLRIDRAALSPDAGIQASKSRDQASGVGPAQIPSEFLRTNNNRLVLAATWELDFWGKYRRTAEAARGELAASEAGRDAVRNTLVADVARGYFALQALDLGYEVSVRTRDSRFEGVALLRKRVDAGVIGELELRQFDAEVAAAEAAVPALAQNRLRQEGALALLLGRSPRALMEGGIERGAIVVPEPVEVPAGLPSDLLLRRPDIRAAEGKLMAANARIGVARAAYFPDISLTGFYGGQSQAMGDLFKGPARTWSFGADLLQPIFAGGQLVGGVELATSRQREAALQYQSAIAQAFKEVREALALQANARDAYVAQRRREDNLANALRLANLRFTGGISSLLDVLDAERQLLRVRLEAIDAERDRRDAIVELYLALGA
jgi:multidrug efflux system outer membrane protein